jgi:D-alanyl-D-alanine carboxypeptidase
MCRGSLSPSRRIALFTLLVAFSAAAIGSQAEARGSRHHGKQHATAHHAIHGADYKPPYAEFVVDANSGQTLQELNADEPRHPASLTKVMTLYLLFEQLEAGKLKLDTPLQISARAALQPPTKLGLKANQTIAVEDAIKGMCTRSANDAALVVAEAIGGSEEEFAKLMTEKARALGMANTTYVNASGLPDDQQITTARDQAILGRAVQDRFPNYYRYFSTANFRYHGHDIHNHNALLGNVKGVDGIKTGYTEASGYNLTTSVHRDGRYLVSVVMGGRSNAARDSRMREMIEKFISLASVQRTAPAAAPTGMDLASQSSTGARAPNAAPTGAAAEHFAPATEGVPPAAAGGRPEEAQTSQPPEQGRAEVHPAKPQEHGSKATAVAKLSSEHSRRSRGRGARPAGAPAATAASSGFSPAGAW